MAPPDGLRLKNTFTKTVEPFTVRRPGDRRVLVYSCGPTVYSYAHIGNFRSFLTADLLRRVLERRGYEVRQVMNITDVGHMTQDHLADATGEDKLAKAARELGWDPYKVAEHYEKAFVADAVLLRMKIYQGAEAADPTLHPRATAHVPEMLVMIQRLLDRGFAYVDSEGQAYFSVEKFPEYGQLSGKVLEELEAGSRVAVRDEKRDPRDFALWKVDAKHLMVWDPHGPTGWPAGDYERFKALAPKGVDPRLKPGFPGWHIECSAMARAHLGELIDVHTGGEDNIFPHHECEIAQSYGAADSDHADRPKNFAHTWVHGRHLLVNGAKMSKSAGTFLTVKDLFDPKGNGRDDLAKDLEALGFPGGQVPPNVLRYALLSVPYVQPMNFTLDVLAQAKSSVERLQSLHERLAEIHGMESADAKGASPEVTALLAECTQSFDEALDDNLTTPRALAAVFNAVSGLNSRPSLSAADAAAARRFLDGFDAVWDVLDRRVRSGMVAKDVLARRAASTLRDQETILAGDLDQAAIEELVALRQQKKAAKDFTAADGVRKALDARGVVLEDAPQGVRWKLK